MIEPTDETLRDWLLGKLAPDQAEPLEQRLIEDDDFAADVRAAENDLLDDLARERLAGDERARAAAYFAATPQDRVRLRIARALAAVSAANTPRGRGHAGAHAETHARAMRPRRRWTAALALAGAAAIAVIGMRFYPDFGTVPVAFTITLTDAHQRGAATMDIAVPRAARELRVQAEVDGANAGARYRLSIDDAFAAHGLAVRTAGAYRFVEATVPAPALAAGTHRVRVLAENGAASESSWTLTTRDE